MEAAVVSELIGPAGVELREVPEPDSEGKVLIDIRAAGISYPDYLITHGKYQFKPEPPFVPGAEVSGVVLSAPTDSSFSAGDRVMATTTLGGYAERVAVDPTRVMPLPGELTFEQGAAMALNYMTMEFVLGTRAGLRAGETVLVLGASGGVGAAAVQLAKIRGARVVAVARRIEGFVEGLGADHIVRLEEDWRSRVSEWVGPNGVDVVVDPVGGAAFHDAVRLLSPGGRLLTVGFAAGDIPEVKVNRLLLRNISVVGAAFGEWIRHRPEDLVRLNSELREHVRQGLRPVVGERFALSDAGAALAALGEGRILGKAVLVGN